MKLNLLKILSTTRSLSSAALLALCGLWLFLGSGCTTLTPALETPAVTVTSFKLLSVQSLTPQFEIGLRVVNPNSVKLSLRGMSYKIFLNNREVVQGVASELPEVPAYGEAEVKVIANVGLLEAMRSVNDMLKSEGAEVAYRVLANLDVGVLYPMIKIEKTGKFAP